MMYTEQSLRYEFVEAALNYKGIKEGSKEHHEIVDTYNSISPLPRGYKLKYTDAWCAAFVSAIGHMIKLDDTILAECSCGRMLDLYKSAGLFVEDDKYIPSLGDIIFYDWDANLNDVDCTGWPEHVGIVAYIENNELHVIEGNYKDSVGIRVIPVDYKFVRGYATPNFKEKADKLNNALITNASNNSTGQDKLLEAINLLSFGTRNDNWVKQLAYEVIKNMVVYNYTNGFASAIVGHAINETGHGSSLLAEKYNNFWGMKTGSKWNGPKVELVTREEYVKGVLTPIKADFRVFDSLEDGVIGFFNFISSQRYSNLHNAVSPRDWMELLKADSYFTSSTQVDTVCTLIDQYHLYVLDTVFNNYKNNLYSTNTSDNNEIHESEDNKNDKETETTTGLNETQSSNTESEHQVEVEQVELSGLSDVDWLIQENINKQYKTVVKAINLRYGPGLYYKKVPRDSIKTCSFWVKTMSTGSMVRNVTFRVDQLIYFRNGDIWGRLLEKSDDNNDIYIQLRKAVQLDNYCEEV